MGKAKGLATENWVNDWNFYWELNGCSNLSARPIWLCQLKAAESLVCFLFLCHLIKRTNFLLLLCRMIVEHWDVQGMVTVALSLLLPLRMEQDADIDTYDYNCISLLKGWPIFNNYLKSLSMMWRLNGGIYWNFSRLRFWDNFKTTNPTVILGEGEWWGKIVCLY